MTLVGKDLIWTNKRFIDKTYFSKEYMANIFLSIISGKDSNYLFYGIDGKFILIIISSMEKMANSF